LSEEVIGSYQQQSVTRGHRAISLRTTPVRLLGFTHREPARS